MLGPEPVWPHLRSLLLRWQTFIAGCLALIAGVGTILMTRHAAAEQVGAAQRQTDEMRTMERRRIAREAYAFYAMMDAAMKSVLDDVGWARQKAGAAKPGSVSPAFQARTRIKKAGFSELRTACLRYGSQQVTSTFLLLDQATDDLSSAWKLSRVPLVIGSPGTVADVGAHVDLLAELNRIEALAKELRDKVGPGIEHCATLLAKTPGSDFP